MKSDKISLPFSFKRYPWKQNHQGAVFTAFLLILQSCVPFILHVNVLVRAQHNHMLSVHALLPSYDLSNKTLAIC